MSTLHVENLKGLSSGGNANKIIVPSGQTLDASAGVLTPSAGQIVQQVEYLKHKYKKNYNTKLIVLGFCLNDLDTNHYKIYWNPKFQSWMKYEYIIIIKSTQTFLVIPLCVILTQL